MTSLERLKIAKAEAQRFIKRADAAISVLGDKEVYGTSAAHAAAKRASMDLTRALADVRKPSA